MLCITFSTFKVQAYAEESLVKFSIGFEVGTIV